MSVQMNVIIRKAKKEDLASIIELVRDLARYEKAENEVVTTIKDYEDAFEKSVFGSHLAVLNDEIIGMTVYYLSFSTWKGRMLYLEDFVVKEKHRRSGAGQLLFDAFLQEAKDQNCVLTKWQVLDWNSAAIRFYEKNKANIEKEWWNCKVSIK